MRAALLVLATIAIAAAPARGDDAADGNSVLGLGFGPTTSVSGELAQYFGPRGSDGGRIRMGGRFGHFGVELDVAIAGLDGDTPGEQAALLWGPSLAYYPLANPWFQLGGRAGLGYGSLEGIEQHEQVPCGEDEPCTVRDEMTTTGYPGFALDLGATLQVHLGRRHGGRAILWVDAGLQLWRFQFPGDVVTGRITQITFGIAHGMSY